MFRLFRKRREEAIAVIEEEPCIHHWIYEAPSGPTSVGICLNCGRSHVAANCLPERFELSPFGSHAKREGR
jgi:hypothetical protein